MSKLKTNAFPKLLLHNGKLSCACCSVGSCSDFEDCVTGKDIEVTLSGVGSSTSCGSCGTFNRTFLFPFPTYSEGVTFLDPYCCYFAASDLGNFCGFYNKIQVGICFDPSTTGIVFRNNIQVIIWQEGSFHDITTGRVKFSRNGSGLIDALCAGEIVTVPFFENLIPDFCNFASATCTVRLFS